VARVLFSPDHSSTRSPRDQQFYVGAQGRVRITEGEDGIVEDYP